MGTAAEHVGYLNKNTYYGITGVTFILCLMLLVQIILHIRVIHIK